MAAQHPPPVYLRSLLTHDYDSSCAADYFCLTCLMRLCGHCCPGHRARHHAPHLRVFCPEVRVMHGGFGPAVDAHEVSGCGYEWTGIRRVRDGTYEKFIPLHPRVGAVAAGGNLCHGCGGPTNAKPLCCTSCRLDVVEEGDVLARQRVQALVNANFGEQFVHDRFCTRCRRFFASEFCPTHIESHHPGLGALITIMRGPQGMVLTPVEGVIPGGLLEDVQVIHVDGVPMVPIRSMPQPVQDQFGMLCFMCFQVIGEDFMFCSMYCKGADHGWL